MRKNNIYLYYFIYLFIFIYSSLVIILLICVISTTQILAQRNTSIIPTVAVPLKNTGSGIQWYKSDWHLSLLYK